MLEVICIGLGARHAGRRKAGAPIIARRLLSMADDKQRIVGEAGGRDIFIIMVMVMMARQRRPGAGKKHRDEDEPEKRVQQGSLRVHAG